MTGTANAAVPDVQLRIGDEAIANPSGGRQKHISSVTGELTSEFGLAGAAEMNAAAESSARAFEDWKTWRPCDRRDVLMKLAFLFEANADELTRLSVLDNGSTLRTAAQSAAYLKGWTAYYAGWADKLDGAVTATFAQGSDVKVPGIPRGNFAYTLLQPFGVVGAIVTWNGPLVNIGMKLGAILAAGNTLVMKPSEFTPYVADKVLQLAREAGIPAGVLNMVQGGADAGRALVEHPLVRKISFTGGVSAARSILAACAQQIKPAVLELGGKASYIIFEDALLDEAVIIAAMMGAVTNSGQACSCASRLLVHRSLYPEVVERTKAILGQMPIGDPMQPHTMIGPVINEAAVNRILAMIDRAEAGSGGTLVQGGKRVGGDLANGYFIEPTIFTGVDPMSEIAQEEVFGPVVSILPFDTEEEAIRIANCTKYGLASFLYTTDLRRAHRVAEQIQSGGVYINGGIPVAPNTPYGGFGMSGIGREGGRQGIDEFLQPKTVAIY